MKLELIDILSSNGAVKSFEGELIFEEETLEDMDIVFDGPVYIKGKGENIGGQIELTANVSGKIKTHCARCTKEIIKDVDFDFIERVMSRDAETEEDDVILLEGSIVDLSDLTLNNFITVAPVKYLCKEDCKGLCPTCGADRNLTDCGCDDEITDPRFDVLNSLFK